MRYERDQPGSEITRWRAEVRRALPGADHEIVEELAQDVCDRRAARMAAGGSEADADALASREIAAWRGRPRPERPTRWRPSAASTGWLADWRYAMRALRKAPLFTVAVILLASIAIGATTAAFSVAYGVLWRPLPYPEGERLAVVWQVNKGKDGQVSHPDFADFSAIGEFDGATALGGGRATIRTGDRIERVNVLQMEPGGFALLGARPARGRLLGPADGGRPVVMISHRLWRTVFAADEAIAGRVMWMSGRNYTIAGVLAPGFDFELPVANAFRRERHDVWAVLDPTEAFLTRRDVSTYEALVRLTPGSTLTLAQAALDGVAQRLARTHPETNAGRSFRVVGLRAAMAQPARGPLLLALGAAVVTLLIALSNLLTLALVRLSSRQPELAIRQAIGAGRFRLARQLATEHAVLVAAATVFGWMLATVMVRALADSEAAHLPRRDAIQLDAFAWGCAAGVAVLITTVLTIVPVRWSAGAPLLQGSRRMSDRAGRRSRRLVVGAQLALAITLTTGGALLGLSLTRLFSVDTGFAAREVAAVRVSAYAQRYPDIQRVRQFFATILEQLRSTPGVLRAAAGSSLPLSGQSSGTRVYAAGQPLAFGARPSAGWQTVTPGYFDTLGMELLAGRDFSPADVDRRGHVTVINAELGRVLFGDRSPLGQRLAIGGGDTDDDWHEIIGIVSDVRHQALDEPPAPRVYDLFGEHWGRTMFVVVEPRAGGPAPAFGLVRRVVAGIDPESPVFEGSTMSALVARSAAPRRLAALLASVLALAAVILAVVGVAAVAAASVVERSREIGVRAALGAAPRDLLVMVLREGARTAAAGTLAGLAGAWVAAGVLGSQLFGLAADDVALVIAGVAAALLAVGILAALPAARRAAAADPLVAIRT